MLAHSSCVARALVVILCAFALTNILNPASADPTCLGAWESWEAPPARTGHYMAFDELRAQVVVFGGENANGALADTWLWDGDRWRKATPKNAPSSRFRGAMAYDPVRARIVMFGGLVGGVVNRETWEWDGQDWSLRSTTGPSARFGHTMVYDAAQQRVVVFAGQASNQVDDSWAWDGATWTQIPTTITPGQGVVLGHEHASSYDAPRNRHVLFSVQGGAVTWERAGTVWSLISNLGPPQGPAGRARGTMAFVPFIGASGASLLFGGTANDAALWAWNGQNWSVQTPAQPSGPGPRSGHAMVYDTLRQRLVVFGGTPPAGGAAQATNETWEWSATDGWTLRFQAPSPRRDYALAYDELRRVTILFGGRDTGGTAFADTWEWDGALWKKRSPVVSPPARHSHAMVYNAAADRVLLFGGQNSSDVIHTALSMWEWSEAGNTWIERPYAQGAGPSPRSEAALTYDRARKTVVLFGGKTGTAANGPFSNEHWEWNGATWTQRPPTQQFALPPAREQHGLVYDVRRRVLVLYGGLNPVEPAVLNEGAGVWEFDPQVPRWLFIPQAFGPRRVADFGIAYDEGVGVVTIHGGRSLTGGTPREDSMWDWDGIRWTQRVLPPPYPTARERHAMAYDAFRARLVVFGGEDGSKRLNDTWEASSAAVKFWSGTDGSYSLPQNWLCSVPAGAGDTAVFDRVGRLGTLPTAYTVSFSNDVSLRRLLVRSDDVRFNLANRELQATAAASPTSPSILVGDQPGLDTRLTVVNSPGGLAIVSQLRGSTVSIAHEPGSIGRLTASGDKAWISPTGDVLVGRRGVGSLRLESGAVMRYGSPVSSFVVGQSGAGSLHLSNNSLLFAPTPIARVSLAQAAGSSATVNLLSGSQWQSLASDFIVGESGPATISISGGSVIYSNSTNRIDLRNATLSISGAGSGWVESNRALSVGEATPATITLSSGGQIGSQGVDLLEHGSLRGDGVVVGNIFNIGSLWPDPAQSPASPTRGRIEVQGNYRQIGPPPGSSTGARSGRLTIDLAGEAPGESSELAVSGFIELAGVLHVRFQNGFVPPVGFARPILSGVSLDNSRFDVAYFPGFPDNRFMQVNYGGVEDGALVSFAVGQFGAGLSLPMPQSFSATAGTVAATGGDINGDGREDLILVAPGSPGSLSILFSKGVDGSGASLGFIQQIQIPIDNAPTGVVAAQLDDRQGIDIAISDAGGSVRILSNNNDWTTTGSTVTGSLTPLPPITTFASPAAIAAGDLDFDEVAEIAVADAGADSVVVLRHAGAGSFVTQATVQLPAGATPRAVDIGDLDNDKDLPRAGIAVGGGGALDGAANPVGLLFVIPNETTNAPQDPEQPGPPPTIMLGDPQQFVVPGQIRELLIRNLTRTQTPTQRSYGEVLAVVQGAGSAGVAVLRNEESLSGVSFAPPVTLDVGAQATSFAAVDFDRDDDDDLAVIARFTSGALPRVRLLRNDSSPEQLAMTFSEELTNPAGASDPIFARAIDISGDARPDLVTVRAGATQDGAASAGPQPNPLAIHINASTFADVNRDGRVDFSDLNIVLGQFGQFGPNLQADLNGDGRVDFVELNRVLGFFGQTR